MMDVNCNGIFHSVKAQIAHFVESKTPGTIVNVASIASERVIPYASAYGRSISLSHAELDNADDRQWRRNMLFKASPGRQPSNTLTLASG